MVGRASDRRHHRRPELDRRAAGGVPGRPARVPRHRLTDAPAGAAGDARRRAGRRTGASATRRRYDSRSSRRTGSTGTRRPATARSVVGAPEARPTRRASRRADAALGAVRRRERARVLRDGPAGCAGPPPESQSRRRLGAAEQRDVRRHRRSTATGSAKFDIWTAAENASLGCSRPSPCSLVAIPIMGISCDPAAQSLPPTDRPPAGDRRPGAPTARRRAPSRPASSSTPTGRRRPGGERQPVVERVELAQPHHRPAQLRRRPPTPARSSTAATSVRRVRLGAAGPGHRAVGAALLPESQAVQLQHVQTGEPEARNAA